MATIYPDGVTLTPKEQETLNAAKELDELIACPGWKKIEAYILELVSIAQDRLDGCISSSDRVRANLHRSAQERRVVLGGIHAYIRAAQADRDHIIENLKKQLGEEYAYRSYASPDYSDIPIANG